MTTIELLSMSKPKRTLFKIGDFFKRIPIAIYNFFRKIPNKCSGLVNRITNPFIAIWDALINGDRKTKLSFIFMGFGQICNKEKIKGILTFIYEIAFILFMIFTGADVLSKLPNLGTIGMVEVFDEFYGMIVPQFFDNSFEILLYSIITIILIVILVILWYISIVSAKRLQDLKLIGKQTTDTQFLKDLGERQFHKTLLSIPMFGIVLFTIVPVIFMILIAFTNYNSYHLAPSKLFDWVGFANFQNIFVGTDVGNNLFLITFLQVLLWTLVWAFFATFTNYFLGMVVAILINTKGIKLKKLWRTVLVTTIAVPQFVSLLLISRMLNEDFGIVNRILEALHTLEINAPNVKLKTICSKLQEQIIGGKTFAQALTSLYGSVFGPVYTSLIKAGEDSGELEETLGRMLLLLRNQDNIKGKIIQASIYPVILILIMFCVLLLFAKVIFPAFYSVIQFGGGSVPFLAQTLIGLCTFVGNFWWLIIIGFGALCYLCSTLFKNPVFKSRWDEFVLKIPAVSEFIRYINLSNFMTVLHISYDAGLPVLSGLELSAKTVGNWVIKRQAANASSLARQGKSLSEAFQLSSLIPGALMTMVATGEKSGTLGKMIKDAADVIDKKVDMALEAMLKLFEPTIIVIMGGFVLFIAMAFYQLYVGMLGTLF